MMTEKPVNKNTNNNNVYREMIDEFKTGVKYFFKSYGIPFKLGVGDEDLYIPNRSYGFYQLGQTNGGSLKLFLSSDTARKIMSQPTFCNINYSYDESVRYEINSVKRLVSSDGNSSFSICLRLFLNWLKQKIGWLFTKGLVLYFIFFMLALFLNSYIMIENQGSIMITDTFLSQVIWGSFNLYIFCLIFYFIYRLFLRVVFSIESNKSCLYNNFMNYIWYKDRVDIDTYNSRLVIIEEIPGGQLLNIYGLLGEPVGVSRRLDVDDKKDLQEVSHKE